jgi:hypothetical protein
MHSRQHKRFNNNSGSNSDKPSANQKSCAGFLKIAPNFETTKILAKKKVIVKCSARQGSALQIE